MFTNERKEDHGAPDSKDLSTEHGIVGYIHNVSPIVNSQDTRFFECQIQTATGNVRGVCFSPEKRKRLDDASLNKSPVKVKRFRLGEREGRTNVLMDYRTQVDICSTPLDFECLESKKDMLTLAELNSITVNQLVNVKGTIKNLTSEKLSDDGKLRRRYAQVVDSTMAIETTFWQPFCDEVEDNATYQMTNMRVRRSNRSGALCLNTAKQGCNMEKITPLLEPLAKITSLPEEFVETRFEASVAGVSSITSYKTCKSCSRKVIAKSKLAKCENCNLFQKAENLKTNWCIKLLCENEEAQEKLYLTMFNEMVEKLIALKKLDINLSTCTDEDLIITLIECEKVVYTYNIQKKVVNVSNV